MPNESLTIEFFYIYSYSYSLLFASLDAAFLVNECYIQGACGLLDYHY